MTIEAIGGITLTALGASGVDVQLTTDPQTYQVIWPKRQVKERVIGDVVTLEWGKVARDALVHAASGSGQFLTLAVVQAMDHNDTLTGETWRLEDYEDNEFEVRIEKWEPVKAFGLPELYEYVLDLEVVDMTRLRGVAQ